MSGYTAREHLVRVCEQGNRVDPMRVIRQGGTEFQTGPNWFACADGTVFSVVAGWGVYCSPRPGFGGLEDFSGPFTSVEVWFDGKDEPDGYVPVADLMQYVREHGGVVDYCPASLDRWEWQPKNAAAIARVEATP